MCKLANVSIKSLIIQIFADAVITSYSIHYTKLYERNVQFYLNGEEAGSVTAKQDFTLSMTVIWDVWTQNERWVGGLPEKDDLLDDTRNTMYVDWIHTYTLAEDFNVSSFAHEDSGRITSYNVCYTKLLRISMG